MSIHSPVLNLFSFTTKIHSWDILSSQRLTGITKIGNVKCQKEKTA